MDGRLSVGAIKNELRATWETRTKKAQVLNVEGAGHCGKAI